MDEREYVESRRVTDVLAAVNRNDYRRVPVEDLEALAEMGYLRRLRDGRTYALDDKGITWLNRHPEV